MGDLVRLDTPKNTFYTTKGVIGRISRKDARL